VIVKDKGKRTGTAIRAKGQQRISDILNAARAILIEDGYTHFSLRNISGRAGIHLSNLQYYFAGKDELIHGLMEFIGKEYEHKYEALFHKLPVDGKLRFEAVLAFLISDIKNPQTRRFFVQLWALLESSDVHSGILLNELYTIQIAQLNSLVSAINPDLSIGKVQQRSAMISAMIEGMMLMFDDADVNLSANEPGIEEEMQKQIVRIAMDK
jgi:AcrR family transcriptional regulator